MADCYHCGLPVFRDGHFPVTIKGLERLMCCPGCQAVASAIVDGGLEKFYDYRSANASTPEEERATILAYYDLPEVQEDFVAVGDDGSRTVELAVSGITCSACAWLIEHHLAALRGVYSVAVNVSAHRCRLTWNPHSTALSALLGAFEEIGYQARPAGDVEAEKQRLRENRTFLLRLGVAGLGMMQAGMVAVALYAGSFYGIEESWRQLLRWVSLLIVTPVVLFSARPFFSAAGRSLRAGHLVMDVPVSLAIALAYLASIWATVTSTGEVYFDSVSMFTFFLLLGRYLEMRVRHRNENVAGTLARLVPPVATRITGSGDGRREEVVPVKSLARGERIRVADGETIPCDGEVAAGRSQVVEAILTGEQSPVDKGPGDAVSAGTVNAEHPLEIVVTATGRHTRLSAIMDLVGDARRHKPAGAALADRLAGYFVAAVLVISASVAIAWSLIDPSRALWVTLSVLVVTCPCALSLATPAALAVATGELRRRGFLIRKGHVLETLGSLDHCIFDKTGTLTLGRVRILAVEPEGDLDRDTVVAVAAALEAGASHPIARAFRSEVRGHLAAGEQKIHLGMGVTGVVDARTYALGKPELLTQWFGYSCDYPRTASARDAVQWLALGDARGVLGWIEIGDQWRPGAGTCVRQLEALGLDVELLSGDRPAVVASMSGELGIANFRGGVLPEGKLSRLRQLQSEGHRVLMVGDGINDVPVLSGADVSVAMGDAADLTRLNADSLLVSGDLKVIPQAIVLARRTRAIIRQNLGWAVAYNLLALPLACLGFVPPWAAAIGMSASSLIVVVNGLRLAGKDVALPESSAGAA